MGHSRPVTGLLYLYFNCLEPSGPLQACNGTALPLPSQHITDILFICYTKTPGVKTPHDLLLSCLEICLFTSVLLLTLECSNWRKARMVLWWVSLKERIRRKYKDSFKTDLKEIGSDDVCWMIYFYIWVSVRQKSVIFNKPTRCNSGSIVFV